MKIIGHEKQWRFLKKSAELGKISHAYLFCGQDNNRYNCSFLKKRGGEGVNLNIICCADRTVQNKI